MCETCLKFKNVSTRRCQCAHVQTLTKKNTTKKSDRLLSHNYTLFVAAVASVFPKGEKNNKQT